MKQVQDKRKESIFIGGRVTVRFRPLCGRGLILLFPFRQGCSLFRLVFCFYNKIIILILQFSCWLSQVMLGQPAPTWWLILSVDEDQTRLYFKFPIKPISEVLRCRRRSGLTLSTLHHFGQNIVGTTLHYSTTILLYYYVVSSITDIRL